jgi:hypothetical protein
VYSCKTPRTKIDTKDRECRVPEDIGTTRHPHEISRDRPNRRITAQDAGPGVVHDRAEGEGTEPVSLMEGMCAVFVQIA